MVKDVAPLPGYQNPYGLLCAILQDATVEWQTEFDWSGDLVPSLGPDVMAWRPYPGGPNIGGQILHMIIAEVAWFEWFVLKREISSEDKELLMWDEIDVDTGTWPDPPSEPMSWYLDLHARYRARTLEAVKQWPAADTVLEGTEHSYSPAWVLGHVIQHEAYHGGQIVMLYECYKASQGGK